VFAPPPCATGRTKDCSPTRSATGRTRTYAPADVRDARVIHQLRLAGHRVPALRQLLPALRGDSRHGDITAALAARHDNITHRSRALLRAAAVLESLIAAAHASDQGSAPGDRRQSR